MLKYLARTTENNMYARCVKVNKLFYLKFHSSKNDREKKREEQRTRN